MIENNFKSRFGPRCQPRQKGIVLLFTLVLLVVLSTLAYTLSNRISAQKHRNKYIIDYSSAAYARDSAIKYALAFVADTNIPKLKIRSEEPDFSDLFSMNELEYIEMMETWKEYMKNNNDSNSPDRNDTADTNDILAMLFGNEPNDLNDVNDVNDANDPNRPAAADGWNIDTNDPNLFVVRGPYGPAWPLIFEPIELEIGSAKITIEIEDENAKYPLGWALLDDTKNKREAAAGFVTFCEWMDFNDLEIETLRDQLDEISKTKEYSLNFKPIKIVERKAVKEKPKRGRRKRRRAASRTKKVRRTIPETAHLTDFAKLFNNSILDSDALTKSKILTGSRNENALKYMGLFGSNKVNINTAPRHVLETAFIFGGDQVEIADAIIQRRAGEPFKDIEDLTKTLFRYSVSIEKAEKFITTKSSFFTIRITTVKGSAKSYSIIAVTKNKNKLERIAAIID